MDSEHGEHFSRNKVLALEAPRIGKKFLREHSHIMDPNYGMNYLTKLDYVSGFLVILTNQINFVVLSLCSLNF